MQSLMTPALMALRYRELAASHTARNELALAAAALAAAEGLESEAVTEATTLMEVDLDLLKRARAANVGSSVAGYDPDSTLPQIERPVAAQCAVMPPIGQPGDPAVAE